MTSIPDWSAANSSYSSSRGYGNAQALGFAQSMSSSLFGASADQAGMGAALFGNAGDSAGMGDALFGPATILDGSMFGNGVSIAQINATRAQTSDSWTGANPFSDPTTPPDSTDSGDATLPSTQSNLLSLDTTAGSDGSKFGALSLDSDGNEFDTINSPADSTKFGAMAIDDTGADNTVSFKVADSGHFGSVGYEVTGNGTIVDLSV